MGLRRLQLHMCAPVMCVFVWGWSLFAYATYAVQRGRSNRLAGGFSPPLFSAHVNRLAKARPHRVFSTEGRSPLPSTAGAYDEIAVLDDPLKRGSAFKTIEKDIFNSGDVRAALLCLGKSAHKYACWPERESGSFAVH